MKHLAALTAAIALMSAAAAAESLEGRWRLVAAEDIRADGSVVRYPWGRHPVGSIVMQKGGCYLQIASSDVPSFATDGADTVEQMKTALLRTYIAYAGPCTVDDADHSVLIHVQAAWRPDYVGTDQKRFFRFEDGKLLFGPAPNSMTVNGEKLTRRLTLVPNP